MEEVLRNKKYILDRDCELRNILSSMQDLQNLMNECSEMIKEQDKSLDNIDLNLTNADEKVNMGKKIWKRVKKLKSIVDAVYGYYF